MSLTLDPKTHGQYASALRTHEALGFESTYDGFLQRLRWKKEINLSIGMAKLLRNAINWKLSCQGSYLSNEQLKTMNLYIGTLSKQAEAEMKTDRPDGVIEHHMLEAMIKAIAPMYASGRYFFPVRTLDFARVDLAVCFCTGLRSCQFASLYRRQFEEKEGRLILTIPKIHDPKARDRDTVQMLKIKIPEHPFLTPILRRRLAKIGPNDLVCCMWPYNTKYNALITALAAFLGFPEKYGVEFHGAHCIRRGAIQYVEEKYGLEESIAFAGHEKPQVYLSTTETHYLATNDQRADKHAKIITAQAQRAARESKKRGKTSSSKTVTKKVSTRGNRVKAVAKKTQVRKKPVTRKR